MDTNIDMIYDVKRKMLKKYPRFGSEIAVANIEFKDDLPFHTAATDGKNIYSDPNYFKSLSEEDRFFTIAHEIMHIKFMHMYRLTDRKGEKRDLELWNIATDAIINANLERDGFTIKEGYVNMPEALNYSAEEFYQKLLQEKEQEEERKKQEQGNGKQQNKDEDGQNQDNKTNGEKSNGDDHSMWEKAFEEYRDESAKQKNEKMKQSQEQMSRQEEVQGEQLEENFNEKQEFENNRKEKREKFKARSEKIKKDIRTAKDQTIKLGDIGETQEAIDWKDLLRREVEKTQTIWSQRRSIAENNYAYRLEENDIEDDAETEVMIDISGSVNLNLVKAFLRQIKPILKQSKLRVGCFNDRFWGLIDIKNVKDIDNFTIPQKARENIFAWTEDWDLAVRSFTKKREINKIVFTDGYPCPGTMPKEDLRRENVIWVVYGNEDFKPCCGKVININERQLKQLHLFDKETTVK